jgi:hypothetical protein
MGNEQAQIKQAQPSGPESATIPILDNLARYAPPTWYEFVKNSGLKKVSLHEYYLGYASRQLTDKEYEKLLTELFRDAVVLGVIVLPTSYTAEDFQFEVASQAKVILRNKPELSGEVSDVRGLIGYDYKLDGSSLVFLRIFEGITRLFCQIS